jgi:putative holliday junction resolvase
MAILAIDYGAKKIGLAKSDESESLALPLTIIHPRSRQDLLEELQEVCNQHHIGKIVVGVPLSFSRQEPTDEFRQKDLENKQLQEVLKFIEWLRENIHLPIETEDERLSTKMANILHRGVKKNGGDDDVAAMLILQSYLDRKKL